MTTQRLPTRPDVAPSDTWDLTSLYADDAAWEADFAAWEATVPGYATHKGQLGTSADALLAGLTFDLAFERAGDRLGTYAFLRTTEDVAQGHYQGMKGRYLGVAARAAEAGSYFRPEVLAIPAATMAGYVATPGLATLPCGAVLDTQAPTPAPVGPVSASNRAHSGTLSVRA